MHFSTSLSAPSGLMFPMTAMIHPLGCCFPHYHFTQVSSSWLVAPPRVGTATAGRWGLRPGALLAPAREASPFGLSSSKVTQLPAAAAVSATAAAPARITTNQMAATYQRLFVVPAILGTCCSSTAKFEFPACAGGQKPRADAGRRV